MPKATSKIYVLDTSVLLFDHNSINNFAEHDVAIPITVLEELDQFKIGNYERPLHDEIDRSSVLGGFWEIALPQSITTTNIHKDINMDFKRQIGELITSYLSLKDEFVASNADKVEAAALKTVAALNNPGYLAMNGTRSPSS